MHCTIWIRLFYNGFYLCGFSIDILKLNMDPIHQNLSQPNTFVKITDCVDEMLFIIRKFSHEVCCTVRQTSWHFFPRKTIISPSSTFCTYLQAVCTQFACKHAVASSPALLQRRGTATSVTSGPICIIVSSSNYCAGARVTVSYRINTRKVNSIRERESAGQLVMVLFIESSKGVNVLLKLIQK